MLAESVSKWSQVLNACSDDVDKVVFIDMNTYLQKAEISKHAVWTVMQFGEVLRIY